MKVSDGPVDTPTSGRTQPASSPDTQFFWDAAAKEELRVQRCRGCGRLRHPPGPACPHCQSPDWEASLMSGRGTLYSYIVLHHPLPAGFNRPAIVVVVELEEGVRIVSNIAGATAESLRIGEPLEVFFLRQEEGWTAPQFRRPSSADL
jgi:uncharacterized OB-fold protein